LLEELVAHGLLPLHPIRLLESGEIEAIARAVLAQVVAAVGDGPGHQVHLGPVMLALVDEDAGRVLGHGHRDRQPGGSPVGGECAGGVAGRWCGEAARP
jgi:hypothetical protein